MTDDKQIAIREDYIDEMHNLDVQQIRKTEVKRLVKHFTKRMMLPIEARSLMEYLISVIDASSAGRTQQTGALKSLSPTTNRDIKRPRHQHKTQRGHHVDIRDVFLPSSPSGSPYPPVRYEWEEWDR